MFDKLRNGLTGLKKALTSKTLDERTLEEVLDDLELKLIEADVSIDVIEFMKEKLKERILGVKVERAKISEFVESALYKTLEEIVLEPEEDLFSMIDRKEGPFVVVFLGINGTGKTTTIAKLAHLLLKRGYRVLLAASDTYRAGAIEQLEIHGKRLGLKTITQRYGADAAAVARDAVYHASSNRYDVVLVDTAGRMQTNRNLLEELAKIIRVAKSDLNVFVGDALAGNDIIYQSKMFLEKPGFDGIILTKVDADVKGGSIINVEWATRRPVMYIGVGQGYEDLIPFSKGWLLERLLGRGSG
jgi:fused signal recognition particle receptor